MKQLTRVKHKQFRYIINATNIVSRLYYKNFDRYCNLCDNGRALTSDEKLEAVRLVNITKKLAKRMKHIVCDANILFWENELQHKYI